MPTTEDEWKAVANSFAEKWGFPHCLGAIDGKHIVIRKPAGSGSYYYNYKKSFSIVLMALVNADCEFLMVDVGANGRVSDGGVFMNSKFGHKLKEQKLRIPMAEPLPVSSEILPYVIVADDAFPLMVNLMKPYPQRNLTKEQEIYNYWLSRSRRVVENAFGILASRFRVFLSAVNLCPSKVSKITLTCCYLHNYLKKRNVEAYLQGPFELEDKNTRHSSENLGLENGQLIPLECIDGNDAPICAKTVRDKFKCYFQ